jgi:hypothetical protein
LGRRKVEELEHLVEELAVTKNQLLLALLVCREDSGRDLAVERAPELRWVVVAALVVAAV